MEDAVALAVEVTVEVMLAGATGKLGRAVPLGAPTGRLGAATGTAGTPAKVRLGAAVKIRTTLSAGGTGRPLAVELTIDATGAGMLPVGTATGALGRAEVGRAEATQAAVPTGEGAWRKSMLAMGVTTPVVSSKANTWVMLAGASPLVEFQHGWAMSMEGAVPFKGMDALPAGEVE